MTVYFLSGDPFIPNFENFHLVFLKSHFHFFTSDFNSLQTRISRVDSVFGAEFHKSRSKTVIIREDMPIFLLTL